MKLEQDRLLEVNYLAFPYCEPIILRSVRNECHLRAILHFFCEFPLFVYAALLYSESVFQIRSLAQVVDNQNKVQSRCFWACFRHC